MSYESIVRAGNSVELIASRTRKPVARAGAGNNLFLVLPIWEYAIVRFMEDKGVGTIPIIGICAFTALLFFWYYTQWIGRITITLDEIQVFTPFSILSIKTSDVVWISVHDFWPYLTVLKVKVRNRRFSFAFRYHKVRSHIKGTNIKGDTAKEFLIRELMSIGIRTQRHWWQVDR